MSTSRTIGALLSLALLAGALPALAAQDQVNTWTTLLVGFPPDENPNTSGVLVVPGMVIPAAGERTHRVNPGIWDEESQAKEVAKTASNLKATFHLSDIDVRNAQQLAFSVNEMTELKPPTPSSTLRITAELLGLDDRTATFHVRFMDRGVTLADTKVAATRGRHTVVGGLDGPEAPYLFLILAPSREAPVEKVHEGITDPVVLERLMPRYTEEAKKNRVQGMVIVQTVIEKDGTVSDVEVLKGLPMGLSESAAEAIRQWRFEPARNAAGEPVAVFYNLTVNFRLDVDKEKDPPVKVLGDIVPPKALQRVQPQYTEEARKERLEGMVLLRATIEKDGAVSDIIVLEGLGLGLSESATEAVRQWRFEPARNANGDPVRVYFELSVRFRLDGEKKLEAGEGEGNG